MGVAQCFGYIGASIWLMVSAIVMGFLIAVYAPHIRSLFYPHTLCHIRKAVYTTQYRCECGRGCRALYPCLSVHARINASGVPEKLQVWPYRVFLDDWKYIDALKGDPDKTQMCFFQVCSPSTSNNRDQVELYKQNNVQPGTVHKCYYDPAKVTNGAFFHRNIHWTLAFHVIAWPGLSLLGSVLMCVYIKYVRRKKPKIRSSSSYNIEGSTSTSSLRPGRACARTNEKGERYLRREKTIYEEDT